VVKIDEVDMKIIDVLEENGRAPNNEIAARLQISEGTVRNRIKKLTESEFLKVKGLTNPNKRTDKQLIFILAKLDSTKKWEETASKIAELTDVKSVSMITGRFDLLIKLFIEPHKLIEFLSHDLSGIGTISSTESLVTIKSFNKWV
jgi:Lrp/AsnC family transcriptional regulator for asnA, asnC and gidA